MLYISTLSIFEIKDLNFYSFFPSKTMDFMLHFFRGSYGFHEILELAGERERSKIAQLEPLIQFDSPYNIQFTSVRASLLAVPLSYKQ